MGFYGFGEFYVEFLGGGVAVELFYVLVFVGTTYRLLYDHGIGMVEPYLLDVEVVADDMGCGVIADGVGEVVAEDDRCVFFLILVGGLLFGFGVGELATFVEVIGADAVFGDNFRGVRWDGDDLLFGELYGR